MSLPQTPYVKPYVNPHLISYEKPHELRGLKPYLKPTDYQRLANTVILTEGEKDADTFNSLNLRDENGRNIVGTTSGSATSWRDSFAEDLKGKRVIILSDNDEAGQRYENAVYKSLYEHGITRSCKSGIFTANALRNRKVEGPAVKDVSEFLETRSVEDLLRLLNIDWIEGSRTPKPPLPKPPVEVYDDEKVMI
jgi:5S rRNA maturation endonuclease (ribonuclease M5)